MGLRRKLTCLVCAAGMPGVQLRAPNCGVDVATNGARASGGPPSPSDAKDRGIEMGLDWNDAVKTAYIDLCVERAGQGFRGTRGVWGRRRRRGWLTSACTFGVQARKREWGWH